MKLIAKLGLVGVVLGIGISASSDALGPGIAVAVIGGVVLILGIVGMVKQKDD
jgi:hypothetical protein